MNRHSNHVFLWLLFISTYWYMSCLMLGLVPTFTRAVHLGSSLSLTLAHSLTPSLSLSLSLPLPPLTHTHSFSHRPPLSILQPNIHPAYSQFSVLSIPRLYHHRVSYAPTYLRALSQEGST
ncbi:hypothetical protein F5X97DRAFT_81548 [Nemania serpens]|nr:hypothetical protein F5X97DRAFT_81548 [Nemania serpens]